MFLSNKQYFRVARNYKDLRTVEGIVLPTHKSACLHLKGIVVSIKKLGGQNWNSWHCKWHK